MLISGVYSHSIRYDMFAYANFINEDNETLKSFLPCRVDYFVHWTR